MATYRFNGYLTVSAWTEVEADSYEQAMKELESRKVASLCASAFSSSVTEAWHFESDGELQEVELETVDDLLIPSQLIKDKHGNVNLFVRGALHASDNLEETE